MTPQATNPAASTKRFSPPAAYNAEEQAYREWIRRFGRRLMLRLPDEPLLHIESAMSEWARYYRELDADEAAEIAAMWWHAEARARRG